MAISHIEMASFIPKSAEASNIKQMETSKPTAEQIAMGTQMNRNEEHDSHSTIRSNESETREFKYDAKDKNNSEAYDSKGRSKNKKKDEKKTEEKKFDDDHQGIDILI